MWARGSSNSNNAKTMLCCCRFCGRAFPTRLKREWTCLVGDMVCSYVTFTFLLFILHCLLDRFDKIKLLVFLLLGGSIDKRKWTRGSGAGIVGHDASLRSTLLLLMHHHCHVWLHHLRPSCHLLLLHRIRHLHLLLLLHHQLLIRQLLHLSWSERRLCRIGRHGL